MPDPTAVATKAPPIPTRGVARRRAKAIARRRWVHELDTLAALAAERLPLYWSRLDMCSCGRTSWLGPDASDAERDEFDQDSAEHAAYCEAVSA
jgi:hypothetical protein